MYTEETVLTYGAHKGKMIKDVPRDYLVNAFITGGSEQEELKEYIEANLASFPGLSNYGWFSNKSSITVQFKCSKRTFPTKKVAMDSIVKSKSKHNKKVPIRAYECPECSGWHLTSKPDPRFKNEE